MARPKASGLGKTIWADEILEQVEGRIAFAVEPAFRPVRLGAEHPTVKAREGMSDFLKRQISSTSYEEFGCGYYGCVFPTQTPSLVLKLTTDMQEMKFAATMVRDGNVIDGIVKYQAAFLLEFINRNNSPVGVLWREEAAHVGDLPTLAFPGGEAHDGLLMMAMNRLHLAREAAKFVFYWHYNSGGGGDYFPVIEEAKRYAEEAYAFADQGAFMFNARQTEKLDDIDSVKEQPRKLAYALAIFDVQTARLADRQSGLPRVGSAMQALFKKGIVLCDVHAGNVGLAGARTGWSQWVITDPGQAVPIRYEETGPQPMLYYDELDWL